LCNAVHQQERQKAKGRREKGKLSADSLRLNGDGFGARVPIPHNFQVAVFQERFNPISERNIRAFCLPSSAL
jgi:hypothetical protein